MDGVVAKGRSEEKENCGEKKCKNFIKDEGP
jgi:hypothetical protein